LMTFRRRQSSSVNIGSSLLTSGTRAGESAALDALATVAQLQANDPPANVQDLHPLPFDHHQGSVPQQQHIHAATSAAGLIRWPQMLVGPESDALAPDALPFGQDFIQTSNEQRAQEVGQDFLQANSQPGIQALTEEIAQVDARQLNTFFNDWLCVSFPSDFQTPIC